MSWDPGAQVDGYRILGQLGAGGMGVVYRAQDLETGGTYALKTLPRSAEPELVERFRREGQAQARADAHPNVVRIHSSGTALGCHYLVMDLASGGDLSERLRQGPLPPERARALGIQLAAGLEWLHQAGVLHRDLKPANVLFDDEQRPLLVDFGLARVEGAESLTQSGTIMGTPAYMSPEQARGDRDQVGPSSDVFGLGALLYHCLTGRAPFQGASTLATLIEVLEGEPAAIRSLSPEVPPGLAAACAQALEKDPERRFPSAAAFGAALSQDEAPATRGPWRVVGLLVGLSLVVAGLFSASQRDAPPTPAPTPSLALAESPHAAPKPWFDLLPREQRPPELPRGLTPAQEPGSYLNAQDGSILVWIPAGAFRLGDDEGNLDESPARSVVVPEGFFLGRYEVSWAQFEAFRAATRRPPLSRPEGETPLHPARATWAEAHAYCEWAGLRLPAEVEWELAAGGTAERLYPWGDEPPTLRRANIALPTRATKYGLVRVDACEEGDTPEGCRNMAGNLPEWTSNQAWRDLEGTPFDDRPGSRHVTRGGSVSSGPHEVRTFSKSTDAWNSSQVGFRVALSARALRDPARLQEAFTFFQAARALRDRDLYPEAAEEIDQAVLRAEPGTDFAHRALRERAAIRNYAKDHEGSIRDWTLLLQFSPGDPKFLRERAFNYVALSKSSLAEADFVRVFRSPRATTKQRQEATAWLSSNQGQRSQGRD
tara:strand:+ start:962 stop:3106 length:2145 start_codon:yes stop_codon:yes gene_type:complete